MTDQPGFDSAGHRFLPVEQDWEPLGHEHWLRRHGVDGVTLGFVLLHKGPKTGRWCVGGITFDIPQAQRYRGRRKDGTLTPVWELRSLDPMHVEPSLLCKAPTGPLDAKGKPTDCGDHGFVRGGLWVPV